MKKIKTLSWSLIVIGTLGLFSSIFLFATGAPFNSYFWGGFCGFILIGTASIELKKDLLNQEETAPNSKND